MNGVSVGATLPSCCNSVKSASSQSLSVLEQRLDDIRYWKKELDEKLSAITSEIDSLLSFKSRLEKTLQSIEEPFHIAQQCLANRLAV